jgi:hypothetical protein
VNIKSLRIPSWVPLIFLVAYFTYLFWGSTLEIRIGPEAQKLPDVKVSSLEASSPAHTHEWSKWSKPYLSGVLLANSMQMRLCDICGEVEVRRIHVKETQ